MNHNHRLLGVLSVTLLAAAWGGAEMGLFVFDDGLRAATPPTTDWQAGDDWGTRLTTTTADSRDTTLEDHVNADYVRRDFTATVQQNNTALTATTEVAKFARGARVHVELRMIIDSVGTIATEIKITPLGLPAGLDSTAIGSFLYLRAGQIITGLTTWDGTDIQLIAGGVRTGQIGIDPSFAAAVSDGVVVNFSYLPAVDT